MQDAGPRQRNPSWWRAAGVPALAAFIGAVSGVLLQQFFLPRTAQIEERAALRRAVVEEQYLNLERLGLLAETGLEQSRTVLGFPRVIIGPDGAEIDRDTVFEILPRVLRDSATQDRWERLSREIQAAERISPRIRETYRQVTQMAEMQGWVEGELRLTEEWGYEEIRRWTTLNERLLAQVETLESLEF